MSDEFREKALINEIEINLEKLLGAKHLSEEDKVSIIKEILALTVKETEKSDFDVVSERKSLRKKRWS